jgi:hypothetical protein
VNVSDLSRLAADYPKCQLETDADGKRTLTCGIEGDPAVYLANESYPLLFGTPQKYTQDTGASGCKWSLPYAVK